MDISPFVTPLLTATIAAGAAYVGAKHGRTASYRSSLYAKQLDACREVAKAVNRISFQELELAQYQEGIRNAQDEWAIFLSSEAIAELNNLINSISDLQLVYKSNERNSAEENAKRADEYIAKMYSCRLRTIDTLRLVVGMKALGGETARLLVTPELPIQSR